MAFVHLNNHTEYSLLNGMIRVSDLVKKAKEFGMPAVAITDYANLFGAVDFYQEAKKEGIKPIVGATVFLPSHDQHNLRQHRRGLDHLFQMVLIIQNAEGYRNLSLLLSKASIDGFYYRPRIDTQLLAQHNKGLLALSGGWDSPLNHYLREGQMESAREKALLFSRIFDEGRYYIELQENGIDGQHDANLELISLAKDLNLPVVATNNSHYLNRDDSEAFEALLCVQTGATLHGAGGHLKFSTDGYYFKNASEMEADFSYCPEALSNTIQIADQVSFDFDLKSYHFPKFEPPQGKTLFEYLKEEAFEGLNHRWEEIVSNRRVSDKTEISAEQQTQNSYPPKKKSESGKSESSTELLQLDPKTNRPDCVIDEEKMKSEYISRLEIELGVIEKTGFAGYFLIVSDFIRHAKKTGVPVGPGRGSAAGSLVAYCTDITDIDPIPYHLLFERFLNPERVSMPDVDIDFCMNLRPKVLEYVSQKYGNVSQIITFGKMKAKAVIRDVGRVLDIPYDDVDKIAKLVPNTLNITLEEALEQEPRLKDLEKTNANVRRLLSIARRLEGLNRHASTHAAGVVISDRPLTDFLPLYKGGGEDIVTQFDMKCVEKIGLIKFDFLGLKTLTIIHEAIQIIKKTRGLELNILGIPINDKKVYELLSRGDAPGIFQLESDGMRDLLVRMKPSTFEDLIALVALYRPGPLGSGMVDDFINRKQGKTPIQYELPQLQPILEDTYGVIVYQEQVMQIASALAGYSLGEADLLRRAMGKKKAEEMDAQRERFLQGAKEKKIDAQKAEKIFDLMAKFAEYGFNKSHSAAYALVSYQTAYLKTHFPTEFMTAILSNEMHDTDKVLYYIQDCRHHGIKVHAPHINQSFWEFTVAGEKEIAYGLGAIKNVGEGAVLSLVESREKRKPQGFTSYYDFIEGVDFKKVNRRVLEGMIKSGALDHFNEKRKAMLDGLEQASDWSAKRQKDEKVGQVSLFASIESASNSRADFKLPHNEEWFASDKLNFEKEAFGFYFSGHPLDNYQAEMSKVSTSDTLKCRLLPNEAEVLLGGVIQKSRVIKTKKGSLMAFATLEDLKGSLEVIFFSDVYQKYADYLAVDSPLVVTGQVSRSEEGVKIIARDVALLAEILTRKTRSIHIKLSSFMVTQGKIEILKNFLDEYKGDCQCYIHLTEPEKYEVVLPCPHGVSLDKAELLLNRVNALFEKQVVEYGM